VLETKTCGVVLVGSRQSTSTSAAHDALGAGALDVLPLPGSDGASRSDARMLSSRLLRLRPASMPSGAAQGPAPPPRVLAPNSLTRPQTPAARGTSRYPKLLAIGASMGGPQAIHQLLASLPRPVTCSIAIVQHIDGIFPAGMTEWLSEGTGVTAKLATPGAPPEPGTALVAGSDGHLILTPSGTFTYADEPRDAIHRPSVDVFFSSLAQHWPAPGIAVLLTGMGRDGAVGLHELRQRGWRTIAQDEATSVVFGMPKAAIQLGAAERTLPIGEIGPAIGRLLSV
jgi:two-component system response regulator WspF